MKPAKQVLYVGSDEALRVHRRMQFGVRPAYKLIEASSAAEALDVLQQHEATHWNTSKSIRLVVIELESGPAVQLLIAEMKRMLPLLKFLLLSETVRNDGLTFGADYFWSHKVEDSSAMFKHVAQLVVLRRGSKAFADWPRLGLEKGMAA